MACVAAARDYYDIFDACCEEGLEGIVDHRFVVDRKQGLFMTFVRG
jgi:hypothetical protein